MAAPTKWQRRTIGDGPGRCAGDPRYTVGNNNPAWRNGPPNKRLTPNVVKAILLSRAHPKAVVAQLRSQYRIVASVSTVQKIRNGTRHWAVHPEIPRQARRPSGRRAKRWARQPEYLTRTGRLRPGYKLVA
jgi:hypothetical protein